MPFAGRLFTLFLFVLPPTSTWAAADSALWGELNAAWGEGKAACRKCAPQVMRTTSWTTSSALYYICEGICADDGELEYFKKTERVALPSTKALAEADSLGFDKPPLGWGEGKAACRKCAPQIMGTTSGALEMICEGMCAESGELNYFKKVERDFNALHKDDSRLLGRYPL